MTWSSSGPSSLRYDGWDCKGPSCYYRDVLGTEIGA